MLRLKRAIGACILASAFLPAVVTHAATYYVATTGNNSNSGTSSKPWRTVAYATSKMVAGDTTYVRGGTYMEGLIQFGRSGTSSTPIKLLNAPGEFPIINFIDRTSTRQLLFKSFSGSQNAIAWITFEGFELRNGYVGLKIINGQNLTIRRNWIHHHLTQGIYGNATKSLIDRNKINHNGDFSRCGSTPSMCNQHHGLYMNGTAITVTNNLFYDNLAIGVQLNGTVSYKSSAHPGSDFALSRNWVITNNTIAYHGYGAGIVIWGDNGDNARIENNILYENCAKCASYHTNGIVFTGTGSTGIVIRNNIAYASGSGGTKFLSSGGSYTQSGNLVNSYHPKFVNAPATLPSSPNFSLASGSPAIDNGLSISAAKISYSGTIRPKLSAYDIGAYEYYGSRTLAAPTSLQAVN
ncbi:MAG: right-handed parallel beta-helix repeat-containing protein [Nitrospira sp.]|nr:right-handed parallel beta-helix repeat-containing protein [Nitrospira sp.]